MSAVQQQVIDDRDQSLKLLEAAFARFTETGERLEARYQALLDETQLLKQQLREKEKEVKRAEKLATLGETAAAIAHEVRNPLGAIKLFISLLRRDVKEIPSAVTLVDQIDTSIISLNHVVENILQFSRGKALTFSPVNLHSLALEQVEMLRPGQAEVSKLSCVLRGSPFLVANEVALRQVLHNLVLNALQATRSQGTVIIDIDGEGQEQVHLTVQDDGPGIPEQVLGSIFDPFVTTKNEGTGLGLAIVQQLVAQHGGTIQADNAPGARFVVSLPRRPQVGSIQENIKKQNIKISGEVLI